MAESYNINLVAYLAEFAGKVHSGTYKKMSYETWRQIDHYSKKDNIISKLDYDSVKGELKLTIKDNFKYHTQLMRFDYDDNSFGAFLYAKYLALKFNQTPCSNLGSVYANSALATYGTGQLDLTENNNSVFNMTVDAVNGWSISDSTTGKHWLDSTHAYPCNELNITTNKSMLEASPNLEFGPKLKEKIKEVIEEINEKETKEMSNLFKNFEFGTCANDKIKMSLYGLAVQNPTGTWVSYDPASATIIDVDPFNFEGGKYLYKMPVAIKDVKEGDLIIHNRKAMFVVDVTDGIRAIDIAAGEEKSIIPTRNMFGFDFITRVTSLFDMGGFNKPNADQPFGNMLPLMLLSGEGNTDDLLPLMMMTNGGDNFLGNPMMMYFLMKDNKNGNDMLPLMFLMNNNK